jgi:CubicO group peptidase (beta-lactamase class C family)
MLPQRQAHSEVRSKDKTNNLAEFFSTLLNGSTSWRVGDRAAYSDLAYILLGFALEKVTGHSYEDVIRNRITKPLGLNSTEFQKPNASQAVIPVGTTWFDADFGNYKA